MSTTCPPASERATPTTRRSGSTRGSLIAAASSAPSRTVASKSPTSHGRLTQTIDPPGVSYNNVDIIYDFPFTGGRREDIAIASDRANDTVAVFRIVPGDGTLQPVTSTDVPASIFGVDDGEATAYGLAAYTSPVTGRHFVFVTQASGNQIAQLELTVDDSQPGHSERSPSSRGPGRR